MGLGGAYLYFQMIKGGEMEVVLGEGSEGKILIVCLRFLDKIVGIVGNRSLGKGKRD